MITVKQESILLKKLKSLTELELVSLFEELADHIYKNRLTEAVQNALDLEDKESEIKGLAQDIDDLQDEVSELESKCQEAKNILSDIEELDEDTQKQIDKAISILE